MWLSVSLRSSRVINVCLCLLPCSFIRMYVGDCLLFVLQAPPSYLSFVTKAVLWDRGFYRHTVSTPLPHPLHTSPQSGHLFSFTIQNHDFNVICNTFIVLSFTVHALLLLILTQMLHGTYTSGQSSGKTSIF